MAPRDIRPGEPNYGRAILEGLSACHAMVLLLTEPSNRSQHVMKETERAVNKNIPILVIKFQPISVSKELEYYVSSAQFLDATALPWQQHLQVIRQHVYDMLKFSSRSPTAVDVAINVASRQTRKRSRWKLRVVGLALLATAIWGAWTVAVPAAQSFLANLTAAIDRWPIVSNRAVGKMSARHEPSATQQRPSAVDQIGVGNDARPGGGDNGSPLMADVKEKIRANRSLADFARSRLAEFHREAFIVTKSGPPQAGQPGKGDIELLTSCRIEPNVKGYLSLAKEFAGLLSKAAQQQGVITSDGLRTSEQSGRDARPYLMEIASNTLGDWNNGLLRIFASDVHQRLVRQDVAAGQWRYASFPKVFLVYDEQITSNDRSGVRNLMLHRWLNLLQQQGSCIIVMLESAENSFRHTTWRWFHLAASDYTTVAPHLPLVCRVVFTLTDSSGAKVEGDYYPLGDFGVGKMNNDRILSLAPFFVNDDFEYYIPEITLTKSVVVLENDVERVNDFTVTIEGAPRNRN